VILRQHRPFCAFGKSFSYAIDEHLHPIDKEANQNGFNRSDGGTICGRQLREELCQPWTLVLPACDSAFDVTHSPRAMKRHATDQNRTEKDMDASSSRCARASRSSTSTAAASFEFPNVPNLDCRPCGYWSLRQESLWCDSLANLPFGFQTLQFVHLAVRTIFGTVPKFNRPLGTFSEFFAKP
jgi:hypothetical protein